MSIEPVALQQPLQIGDSPRTASASGSTASSVQSQSFAKTLAKVQGELMALDALSGSVGSPAAPPFSSLGNSAQSGGIESELSLISTLLAAQKGNAPAFPGGMPISPSSGSVSGSEVVSEAAKFIGTPYVWGGTSPSGFDCSGLVQYVYGHLGINLPRTSQQQANVGVGVSSVAQARPGDLVFFAGSDGTSASPGHVGIYIGNGEMIDAPHTGTAVQVQSVSSSGPVVAIRRVLADGGPPVLIGGVKVPAEYAGTIAGAADANGIPASLLAALISQESGFNPSAVSSAGALGIAQFMPQTASGLGVNPLDPTSAINGAAGLIGSYLKRFGSYADALAAYNAGSAAVASYGGVPPYPETQAYVSKILSAAGLAGSLGGAL